MSDNGHTKDKICPFSELECEKCRLSVEMAGSQGGLMQKFSMCAFPAMVQMLSELNIKTQPPQQKIQIPNLLRG